MTEILSTARGPVLVVATVCVGLQAGLYLAFAVAVMPGLARVDDPAFVATMQQTNVAILNPVFLLTFVGAPLLAVLAVVVGGGSARPWLLAGAVLAVATVVVTVAGNVPLNDALAAGSGAVGDAARLRADFEGPWVRLNLVRTVTSAGALLALAVGCVRS